MRAALLALVLVLASAPLPAADRHVAVIIDTSGSMVLTDQPRYTVQLTQIISDLIDAGDHLTVIRLPPLPDGADTCREGVDPRLALPLGGDRARFKAALDRMIVYDGGNNFAAPVRTAIHVLSQAPDKPRLLLMLADSGGLGDCAGVLTRELVALRASGATIAAINLGSTAGAFDGNPAFDFTTAALNAEKLVAAVAHLYQRFLGARRVQTGQVSGTIEVEIAAFVQEAFLVVAADGPVPRVESLTGNPGAAAIDPDHRGGGRTQGLDGRIRGYRIVRLERPAAGRWRFRVPGLDSRAGWMLLQDSAVGVRLASSPGALKGQSTPVELELYDLGTGQRITDPGSIPGLSLRATLDGRTVEFRDDGKNGDRAAGDGVFTALARFDAHGPRRMEAHLQGKLLDRKVPLEFRVLEAGWELRVTTPSRAPVGRPVDLGVQAQTSAPAGLLAPIERVRVLADGREIAVLRDDGSGGDERAGDGRYGGAWTPDTVGTFALRYIPEGGPGAEPMSAPLEVIESTWTLGVITPRQGKLGEPLTLSVTLKPGPEPFPPQPPEAVLVRSGGAVIATLRDGGDGVFSATWTPDILGTMNLTYETTGGSRSEPASAPLEVVGSLKFGPPQPVHLGPVEHDSEVTGILDLASVEAQGNFGLRLSSDYDLGRTVLELHTGDGWMPLGPEPAPLKLLHRGPRTWPLRLRTGRCPEGCPPGRTFAVRVESTDPDGKLLTMTIPLTVEVIEQPWLVCWWPVIATAAGMTALGLIVYGFWSPSRFPGRLGVVLSQEDDMNEGFFHPIRAQKGTGSGFYRDARVYVCHDYRLSGKARNAIACLRAHHGQVRIQPVGGSGVLRLTPEEGWEALPGEETAARFGIVYRDEAGGLFFELRNG